MEPQNPERQEPQQGIPSLQGNVSSPQQPLSFDRWREHRRQEEGEPAVSQNQQPPKLPRRRKRRGLIPLCLGILCFLAAGGFTAYNLIQIREAQRASEAIVQGLPPVVESALGNSQGDASDLADRPQEDWPMPVAQVDQEEIIGVIEIQRNQMVLPVLSTWDYAKLKRYPCYYHGSVYSKDAVFCSHDYPFQFGGLHQLQEGDTARFIDVKGNIFTYAYREREYLQPQDVEQMVLKDNWDLTLFTCAFNGVARYAYRFEEVGFQSGQK